MSVKTCDAIVLAQSKDETIFCTNRAVYAATKGDKLLHLCGTHKRAYLKKGYRVVPYQGEFPF